MEKTPAQIAREREAIKAKIVLLFARKETEMERLRQEHEAMLLDYASTGNQDVKERTLARISRERDAVLRAYGEKKQREEEALRALQAECPHKNRSGGHCPDCGK